MQPKMWLLRKFESVSMSMSRCLNQYTFVCGSCTFDFRIWNVILVFLKKGMYIETLTNRRNFKPCAVLMQRRIVLSQLKTPVIHLFKKQLDWKERWDWALNENMNSKKNCCYLVLQSKGNRFIFVTKKMYNTNKIHQLHCYTEAAQFIFNQ